MKKKKKSVKKKIEVKKRISNKKEKNVKAPKLAPKKTVETKNPSNLNSQIASALEGITSNGVPAKGNKPKKPNFSNVKFKGRSRKKTFEIFKKC